MCDNPKFETRIQKSKEIRYAIDRHYVKEHLQSMASASQAQKNLQAAMRDALRIQDRFVSEPLFAKTGRGHLKSEGLSTLNRIKANLCRKPARHK